VKKLLATVKIIINMDTIKVDFLRPASLNLMTLVFPSFF